MFRRTAKTNVPKKRRLPGEVTKKDVWRRKANEACQDQVVEEPKYDAFSDLLFALNKKPDNEDSSDDDKVIEHPGFPLKKVKEFSETVIQDDEVDDEVKPLDPFSCHFETDHQDSFFESAKTSDKVVMISVPSLGTAKVTKRHPSLQDIKICSKITDRKLVIEESLVKRVTLQVNRLSEGERILRMEFLSLLNGFSDVFYPQKKFEQTEGLRWAYCLHILNYIVKTRHIVMTNIAKIEKAKQERTPFDELELRDSGFNRAKVLILVPFRESCKQIVLTLSAILFGDGKPNTIHYDRFNDEFASGESNDHRNKPTDFLETFTGNIDDNFRMGIAVTKKSLKLYTDFYASDIIIASPLSLRMKIKDSQEADYDFLSSIEVLVLDQTEVFLMQNWEHVIEVMNHTNLQPKESSTDLTRVKMSFLDGHAKHYRQNIFLSSTPFMEVLSLFEKYSCNFEGRISFVDSQVSTISRVYLKSPQEWYPMTCPSLISCPDSRFDFFVKTVLPEIKSESHLLIYFSCYFDFVRVRNHLKKEEASFVSVCEYTDDGKVAQGRSMFFHGGRRIFLYTERLHFYKRLEIKGVRKVVFYQLPSLPLFYSQVCNFMMPSLQGSKFKGSQEDMKAVSIFCPHDYLRLQGVVGSDRAKKMIRNLHKKKVFSILTTNDCN